MDIDDLRAIEIKTKRLVLRVPTKEEIVVLAQVAVNGIQQPGEPHFQSDDLYDRPVEEIEKSLNAHVDKHFNEWNKNNWQLPFAVFYENKPIGMITIFSNNFPIAKGFGCGYWLGLPYQGKGLGTEMLQGALAFGFDGLHAREAYVGAWSDNNVSIHLLEKLGFVFNGEYWMARQGKAVKDVRMRLPSEKWSKPDDISLHGFRSDIFA